MRRVPAVVVIALSIGLWIREAAADSVPPFMFKAGNQVGDPDTVLSVDCSRSGRGIALCRLTYVGVHPPKIDAAERAKEAAEFEKRLRSKEGQADFKKTCAGLKKEPVTGLFKRYADRMQAACSGNDPVAFWKAALLYQEEVGDQTCQVDIYSVESEFTKVDDSTWRSIDSANDCRATVVQTLSRKSGLWTYDRTRTVPANASDTCKNPSGGTSTTTTFGPFLSDPRELHCRYWK